MHPIEFPSLSDLMAATEERLGRGWRLSKATDPRGGLLGFAAFDESKDRDDPVRQDEYLFVNRTKLSTSQMQAWVEVPDYLPVPEPVVELEGSLLTLIREIEQDDTNAELLALIQDAEQHDAELNDGLDVSTEDLSDLWSGGLMTDVEENLDQITRGERDAATDWGSFPTPTQMTAWCGIIETGIRAAGFDWTKRSFAASPFTFSWGTHNYKEHDGQVEVRTDHLGVDIAVGTKLGVQWSGRMAYRVLWGDPEFGADIIEEQVRIAWKDYEAIPRCNCEYHQCIRAGRIK